MNNSKILLQLNFKNTLFIKYKKLNIMVKTKSPELPKNPHDLFIELATSAKDFGFKDYSNGILRDCIHKSKDKDYDKRELKEDPGKSKKDEDKNKSENNFWFGFIREDQTDGGPYDGLSFVVFPEFNGDYCLAGIGIGSNKNLGADINLASGFAFRRSFMRLKEKSDCECHFFFKTQFDELEEPTPGLQEESEKKVLISKPEEKSEVIETTSEPEEEPKEEDAKKKYVFKYDECLRETTKKYNHDDKGGLLPAVMIVKYKTPGGIKLLKAWLAQYAKWRNWDRTNKGEEKKGNQTKAINDAINLCKVDKPTLKPDDVCKILMKKQFIVLQGAPGCGKTWTANEVADLEVNGKKFFAKTEFIQFHAETTYSDFIYGIKPVLDGEKIAYKGEKGTLLRILDEALKTENIDKKYLLIIDEFNRANLANVLGQVFYLFEKHRKPEHQRELILGKIVEDGVEKELKYSQIPDNLYVIATMNTADKSLAVVDFALRRRFSWITLYPHPVKDTEEIRFDKDFYEKIDDLFMEHANDEELNLQPGQSYFMYQCTDDQLKQYRKDTIKYGLMPLMKEYFAEGLLMSAKDAFAQLFYSETDGEVIMYE